MTFPTIVAISLASALPALAAASTESPARASAILEAAIERGVPAFNDGKPEECVTIYQTAAREVLNLPADAVSALDRADLTRALGSLTNSATENAWTLRRAFDRTIGNEQFKPQLEAPLPEGFPGPGPIGRVIEKTYPAYRSASAEGGRAAFWSLFRHIQKNEVAMTAPVEMTLGSGMQMERMAFLYERPAQGRAGEEGVVRVADLPAVRVVSIALRGRDNEASMATARALVEEYLKTAKLQTNGLWRVMGYNSPMVSDARRVWELQVPVK